MAWFLTFLWPQYLYKEVWDKGIIVVIDICLILFFSLWTSSIPTSFVLGSVLFCSICFWHLYWILDGFSCTQSCFGLRFVPMVYITFVCVCQYHKFLKSLSLCNFYWLRMAIPSALFILLLTVLTIFGLFWPNTTQYP